jgi:hypothetical protein
VTIKRINLDEIAESTRTSTLTAEDIAAAVETLRSGEAVSTGETFTTQGRAQWAADRVREDIEREKPEFDDGLRVSTLTWTDDGKKTYRFAIVLR